MGYGLPEWLGDVAPPSWVSPEQALQLQDMGKAILVDCRDPVGMGNGAGHAEGAPEGSFNIPAAETMMFPDKVNEFIRKLRIKYPGDTLMILMSNTGMPDGPQAGRCKYVAIYMQAKNLWDHDKILRMDGGLKAWQEMGLPMEVPSKYRR